MKILFIGENSGNSKNSYLSLKEIYPATKYLFIDNILSNLEKKIFYHVSPFLFINKINQFYKNKIKKKYDIIYIHNVEYISKFTLELLKKNSNKIYYFCADNPFLKRDKFRWSLVKKIISKFDLVIFQQKNRKKFVKKFKIKKYIFVLPSYFKHIQKNFINKKKIKDIVFVGTWFPERGKFFYELKKKGLKIDIYGYGWHKDKKHYRFLKKNIQNKYLTTKKVSKIISDYKIAISLYSLQNKDDITNRSIEIPALGSLICSQRTKTMQKILKENKEAVYFSTTKECFSKCNKILKNKKLLDKISINGNNKIRKHLKPEAKLIFKFIFNETKLKKNINKWVYKYT